MGPGHADMPSTLPGLRDRWTKPQIISFQSLHYLALSLLLPPLLATFTSPALLTYSGGPSTVSHIMDWREMAARPTVSSAHFHGLLGSGEGWRKLRGAWAGGKQVGVVEEDDALGVGVGSGVRPSAEVEEEEMEVWDFGVDDSRGWVIGVAWLMACGLE